MKALIRGLPSKLRWHVISFNPTTLNETIQRILLGEATLASEYGDQINVMEENSMINVVRKLDEKMDKLEDMVKGYRIQPPQRNSTQYVNNGSTVPTCQICGKFGHSAADCFLRQQRVPSNDYSTTQRFDNGMSRTTGGIYGRGTTYYPTQNDNRDNSFYGNQNRGNYNSNRRGNYNNRGGYNSRGGFNYRGGMNRGYNGAYQSDSRF